MAAAASATATVSIAAGGDNSAAFKIAGDLEVPRATDDRLYRAFQLPNGLQVLAVSDRASDSAAAAMSVSVGSMSDPVDINGIAHFTEHLCFMGSAKFPKENEYSDFLAHHGGWSNAWTSGHETNYHFQVAPDSLHTALDMFAQFFIAPLFLEGSVSRELEAVDSEHAKNLQSDGWRAYQLSKSLAAPAHPYSMFGTGDSRTLRDAPVAAGIDVRARVMAFHAQHYSANRMRLVVVGCEDLDTLAAWAAELFTTVPLRPESAPLIIPPNPYVDRLGTLVHALPVKNEHRLVVTWVVPQEADWPALQRKTSHYVSHLIGHEGPGSLLSLLKAHGWATGLSAGVGDSNPGFALFDVGVDLTEAGLLAHERVIIALYAYVGMLRAAGPLRWVYDEMADHARTSFRFLSKSQPVSHAVSLASSLQHVPSRHALSSDYLYWEWDPAAVSAMVDSFTPARSRVTISSQHESVAARCSSTERWYGIKHSAGLQPPALIAACDAAAIAYMAEATRRGATKTAADLAGAASAVPTFGDVAALAGAGAASWAASIAPLLALPAPNEFLATDFTLRCPALAAKQAEVEVTPGMCGSTDAEGDDGGDDDVDSVATGVTGDGDDDDSGTPSPAAGRSFEARVAAIKKRREVMPVLLSDDRWCTLWWHQDDHFGVPKAYVDVQLALPAGCASPTAMVHFELFTRLLTETLNELAYAASLADLRYAAAPTVQGLQLSFSGFSHKLPRLAAKVVERLVHVPVDEVVFASQLDKLSRKLRNFDKDSPLQHASYAIALSTMTPRWHNDDKVAVVDAGCITPSSQRAFHASLFSGWFATICAGGNLSTEEARAIAEVVMKPLRAQARLPLSAMEKLTPRVVQLPLPVSVNVEPATSGDAPGRLDAAVELWHTSVNRNGADPNAAMVYTLQTGPAAVTPGCKSSAVLRLVSHLLEEPFFDMLRTQQQLGYLVHASIYAESNLRGISFSIQSSKVTAEELVARTDSFLEVFRDTLAAMPGDKFDSNKLSILTSLNESDKSLSGTAGSVWGSIQSGLLGFTNVATVTRLLAALTKTEVLEWYDAHILPGGPRRRVFISLENPAAGAGAGAGAGAAASAAGVAEDDGAGAVPAAVDASPAAGGEEAPTIRPPQSVPIATIRFTEAVQLLQAVTERSALLTGDDPRPTIASYAIDAAKLNDVALRVDGRGRYPRVIARIEHYDDVRGSLPTWAPPSAVRRFAVLGGSAGAPAAGAGGAGVPSGSRSGSPVPIDP